MQQVKQFVSQFFMFVGALALGFVVFMSVSVVMGQSAAPPVGPPGGNPPPPLNAGLQYQEKQGILGASGFFDVTRQASLNVPKLFHMEADSFNNNARCIKEAALYEDTGCTRVPTGPSHMHQLGSLAYSFCSDRDGCDVTVSIEDGEGVRAKGPGRLFISPAYGNRWRITKTLDPYDSSITANEGRDAAGGPQSVLAVGSGKCRITDEDSPGSDNAIGLSLELSGTGASFVCMVDIRD